MTRDVTRDVTNHPKQATERQAGSSFGRGDSTLYTLFNLPQIDQVYLLFRASILEMNLGFTEETLEAKLFTEAEIPWNEIAFPVIRITLEHYFRDMETQHFPVRMFDVTRNGRELDVRLISESGATD